MEDEKRLDIDIELLGHKGKIKRILALPANYPFRREDSLAADVTFDEPHPASIISTWFCIPVKDYSREELLAAVKKFGEEQLAAAIKRHDEEQAQYEAAEQHKKELDAFAESIEQKLL